MGDALRPVRVVVAALLVAMSMSILGAPRAEAWQYLGCRWQNSEVGNLLYRNTTTAGYVSSGTNAVSAWNATSTPVSLTATSGYADIYIVVVYNILGGYTGMADYACSSNGYLVSNPTNGSSAVYAYVSSQATATYSSTARKQLIVHELGHLLGLGHQPANIAHCSTVPIMDNYDERWFSCSKQVPQPDDVAGINYLY